MIHHRPPPTAAARRRLPLISPPAPPAPAQLLSVGPGRTPVCVEPKRAKAAQQAATRELRKRLRARQQELGAGFLAQAWATTAVDGSLLRFLLGRTHDRCDLAAAARPLGIELSTYAREGELATVRDGLLVPFAKLLQPRVESGAWRECQNPEEERIRQQLAKEYRPGLDALLAGIRAAPPAEAAKPKQPGARARRREKKVAEAEAEPSNVAHPSDSEPPGGLGIPPDLAIGAPHGPPPAAEVAHA